MAYNAFYKELVYLPNLHIAMHISDNSANTFKLHTYNGVPRWFEKLNFDEQESIPLKVAEDFIAHCYHYTPPYAWERNVESFIYTGVYDISDKIADFIKYLKPYTVVGLCGGFGIADDESVVRKFEYYPHFLRVESGSLPYGRVNFFSSLYKSGEVEKMTGKPLGWSMYTV